MQPGQLPVWQIVSEGATRERGNVCVCVCSRRMWFTDLEAAVSPLSHRVDGTCGSCEDSMQARRCHMTYIQQSSVIPAAGNSPSLPGSPQRRMPRRSKCLDVISPAVFLLSSEPEATGKRPGFISDFGL